jgi:hypothetical protein
MTFLQSLHLREATHDLAHVLAQFLVRFLAAMLQFSNSSLPCISLLHRASVTTVGMIVKVVFNNRLQFLLKCVKIQPVAAKHPAPKVPFQTTIIHHSAGSS